jgi:hypothetical protein
VDLDAVDEAGMVVLPMPSNWARSSSSVGAFFWAMMEAEAHNGSFDNQVRKEDQGWDGQ